MGPTAHRRRPVVLLALTLLLAGCSIRKLAVGSLASALGGSGDVFASDDDPQLVREAVPFALKTYETLLVEVPHDRALLLATARGFTQYAHAFVRRDAELLEERDIAAGREVRRRARRLLLRGRDHALAALELGHPGLPGELRRGRWERLAQTGREDAPVLFWAAAAWGDAISVLKDDAELIGDLSAVEAMLRRVIELDESFERGAAHEVMVSLEAGLAGGSLERAERHFDRAVELSGGALASPYVAMAESVAVQRQDRARFDRLLDQALGIDPDRERPFRLANLLAQERARWLKVRADELFF